MQYHGINDKIERKDLLQQTAKANFEDANKIVPVAATDDNTYIARQFDVEDSYIHEDRLIKYFYVSWPVTYLPTASETQPLLNSCDF